MDSMETVSDRVASSVTQALIGVLGARLGPNGLKSTPDDMAPYLREERSLYRGEALAIARPASVEEVAFTVEACAKAGMPVVPQGGNTGLVGGQVAFGGLVLSLERMKTVRAVDAVNGTITVDAGCTLHAVQEAAKAAGALFPLSLASEGTCQIGGNIASNAGGTAVLRYGSMRDLVLGLEVVLADGRVWNGLRGLRKDNAGYDLKQAFIGSEGTLGIVTGAVLKLFPRPSETVTAFIGCASPQAALALFSSARSACGDVLGAFELLPRFGLETVVKHAPGKSDPLGSPHAWYVLVEFASQRRDGGLEARMEDWLASGLDDGLIEDATIGASEARSAALWALREELSWAQKFEGGSIKHDVSVPISSLADFITEASDLCEREMPGLRVCAFGHLGDGNVHFNLSQPVGMDTGAFLSQWSRFNRIVHDLVHRLHGSIAAEHGIGRLKREELSRYKDEVSLDLMRRLKTAFDPAGLLNPGKVIDACKTTRDHRLIAAVSVPQAAGSSVA